MRLLQRGWSVLCMPIIQEVVAVSVVVTNASPRQIFLSRPETLPARCAAWGCPILIKCW